MQIQLHLKWRFALISLEFYDHWNRELNTVVLHPSPLAVVHVVRVGSKEEVGCDNWVLQGDKLNGRASYNCTDRF